MDSKGSYGRKSPEFSRKWYLEQFFMQKLLFSLYVSVLKILFESEDITSGPLLNRRAFPLIFNF